MRKIIKYILAFVVPFALTLLVLYGTPAFSQQLKVATGSQKGTYAAMFKEAAQRCAETGLSLVEINTTGSMENVNLLTQNQVNAGFSQTDVLFFRQTTEDLSSVKTLVALHPEEVHLVALRTSKVLVKDTSSMNPFAKAPAVFNTLADLGGRNVGAAGGSHITAQVIRLQSEVPFNVVSFEKNEDVLAALQAGQIEAGLFVGGQPLPLVAALNQDFKLLSIPPPLVERLKRVYRPATLNYSKMGAAGVATVATDALFVTRQYRTPKMVEGLAALRGCIVNSIPELQETTGTHPKWQAVDPSNKGKWAWYDLPEVAQAPTTPPTPGRKR